MSGSGKKRGGKAAIRAAVAGAADAPAPPRSAGGAPSYLAQRFEMTADGLFRKNQDDTKTWLSAPFEVMAELRDGDRRGWGVLLRWRDRDGHQHEEAFARAAFAGEAAEVRGRLADGGLSLNAAQSARQAFAEFLNVAGSPHRAHAVARTGWHVVNGRHVHVLPDASYGGAAEKVILQTDSAEPHPFNVAGTAEQWRDTVGRLCCGNSLAIFAASCGFAAPLLAIVGDDGGGIHFRGASRSGKTTLLRLAASVCGGTPGAGAAGYVKSWRSTVAGLEAVAAGHCDMLLVLDEIGEADGRDVAETAYMLSNGTGKARAARTGGGRAPLRWRTLFLSSGEVGLADKLAEVGQKAKAGMETRIAEVSADAGAGLGAFEELHDHDGADGLARALQAGCATFYGAPLRTFLRHLAEDWNREPVGFADACKQRVADLVRDWLVGMADAGGQVKSVARRFALIALAGELATAWLLTGWPRGDATEAAHTCFISWLADRGTVGAREDVAAVRQLRDFIQRHGGSRFEDWTFELPKPGDAGAPADGDGKPPAQRFRIQHRAGWRRWDTDGDRPGWCYFLTPEAMREALAGLPLREALDTLARAGHIVGPPGASDVARAVKSALFRVPGEKSPIRLYRIGAGLMESNDGD